MRDRRRGSQVGRAESRSAAGASGADVLARSQLGIGHLATNKTIDESTIM